MYSSTVCTRCLFRTIRNVKSNSRGKLLLSKSPRYFPVRGNYIEAENSLPFQSQRAAIAILASRRFYSTIPQPNSASSPSVPPPPASQSKPTSIFLNPRYSSSGDLLSIKITPRAAHRLNQLMENDANPLLCLRVQVESGGCHGFQYLLNLTTTKELDKEEEKFFVVT